MTSHRRTSLGLFWILVTCFGVGIPLVAIGRFVLGDNWNALTTPGFGLLGVAVCAAVALVVVHLRVFHRSLRS